MKIIAITPDKKRDFTTEQTLEGLQDLGCEIIASDVGNGVDKSYSDDQILKQNADVIIAFFGKVRDNRPPKYYLIDLLKGKLPLVYVDGSEWTYTGYPTKDQVKESLLDPKRRRGEPWLNEIMLKSSNLYFKRECYPEDLKRNIIPHPFCLSKRHLSHRLDKDIDLLCVFGQVSTGLRQDVTKACRRLKEETNFNIVVENNISPERYRDVLSRSRIVIDAWGGGDTCDRFYEAVGAGACCMYQKYNIVIENPYVDMQDAVEYWDLQSFIERVKFLLNSKNLCHTIGDRGKQHALSYHTTETRARKILQLLQR